MLYNDLDKIPLDIFIDVFLGEKRKTGITVLNAHI